MCRRGGFCDNCGRVMVLRNGPWGPFMACPGYNEDPPCKTIRKLTQKVQTKPPVQLEEACPKCGKPLLQRDGQYGEFIACSGYPKCKYVKQELLDVKCPKDGRRYRGAEDKARRPVLWLRELSQVRLRQQSQAGERDLSQVRQRLSA